MDAVPARERGPINRSKCSTIRWRSSSSKAIDYPSRERFGASAGWAQWQALRERGTFDREIRRFLHDHPDGTVVALGEGLETQLWRVNNNQLRWVSVDLPPVIELRQRFLPSCPRQELVASSVS